MFNLCMYEHIFIIYEEMYIHIQTRSNSMMSLYKCYTHLCNHRAELFFIKQTILNLYYNIYIFSKIQEPEKSLSSDSSLIQTRLKLVMFLSLPAKLTKSFQTHDSVSGLLCLLPGEFLELPVMFFQHQINFTWLSQQWTRHVHFVFLRIILHTEI